MANDVNNTESHTTTPHADKTQHNRNTTDNPLHPKETTQTNKDQQENERITGDIFYPFSSDRPIPTKTYTPSAKHFEYKTRPKYIHTKLSLRQIHKLDDEYEFLRKRDTISPAVQQRLTEINTITARWEQQDTHIPKRRPDQTMGPKTPQQSTQSQKHQEQRQITSYDQWTQHTEQTKQQSRRQHIRLLDADYRTMTIGIVTYTTPQQQTSTKSVWTINKEIATGNIVLNNSNQYDSNHNKPT